MAVPYLLLLFIWLLLIGGGLYRRRRCGLAADRAFASKLAWVSFGLASAVAGVIIPSLWLFVSLSVHGGTVEANVPPGYSVQFILGVLLIGAAFVAVSAVYGYLEHLSS